MNIKSNNQKGGITAGVINISTYKKNKKKYSIIALIMLILAVLTFFGLTGDKMFGKNKSSETYNVESNHQSGGVTVGKIDNLTINPTTKLPEPKFNVKILSSNIFENSLYKSEFMLSIDTPVAINNLYLEVKAPTIVSMDVVPQRSGIFLGGNTGMRERFAFTNLQQAYGEYMITVFSKEKAEFEITYNY